MVPANGKSSWVTTFERQIQIASHLMKISTIYHNLLRETNFGVKFYFEAPYSKNLYSSKKSLLNFVMKTLKIGFDFSLR